MPNDVHPENPGGAAHHLAVSGTRRGPKAADPALDAKKDDKHTTFRDALWGKTDMRTGTAKCEVKVSPGEMGDAWRSETEWADSDGTRRTRSWLLRWALGGGSRIEFGKDLEEY
jgi:hypothetical protein